MHQGVSNPAFLSDTLDQETSEKTVSNGAASAENGTLDINGKISSSQGESSFGLLN